MFDTGASLSITPIKEDFIEPLKPSKVTHVRWTVTNCKGKPVEIITTALYLLDAEVRLFSPQEYCAENEQGMYFLDQHDTFFETGLPEDGVIEILYEPNNNLPMVIDDMSTPSTSSTQQHSTAESLFNRWHQHCGHRIHQPKPYIITKTPPSLAPEVGIYWVSMGPSPDEAWQNSHSLLLLPSN